MSQLRSADRKGLAGYNISEKYFPVTGDRLALLPLFPLDVVLFPGTPLPLHIFEPRYREMIAECRDEGLAFGVIRALEQNMAEIGCTAEIISFVKEYADGRFDIVTEGRKRFEVLQINRERAFLRAEVLMVEDEPASPAQADTARAVQLHSEILAFAGAEQDISAADPSVLSFYLAGSLPLDLDFKQKMLELRSEPQRIVSLVAYLEKLVPTLLRTATARQKAGGNGHVR